MTLKRIGLILVLIVFSLGCFYVLNNKYDPLARYPYVTSENREIILDYMTQKDIDYIIQQKIKPEQFMNFIQLEGFKTENILYYDLCDKSFPIDRNEIVYFINTYRDNFDITILSDLLSSYGYEKLKSFYEGNYLYIEEAELITNPDERLTKIGEKQTLYTYEPKDLVTITNSVIPFVSSDDNGIQLKQEVIAPLQEMCSALAKENGQTAGGLILMEGYVSYQKQIELYEQALIEYGVDKFRLYTDYPGQNEKQLGYTLSFTVALEDEEKDIKDSSQVKWLKENAEKYGFIIRYPENQEKATGKYYQPLTLRYVGNENTNKFNVIE